MRKKSSIMYLARSDSDESTIVPVEVTRCTEYNVWFPDGSRRGRDIYGEKFFDTFHEARQWLQRTLLCRVVYLENSIKNYTESLAITQARIAKLEAMKEPEGIE